MQSQVLYLDLETYSDQDINFGPYKYTDTSEFLILLMAYAFDEEPVQLVDLQQEAIPGRVLEALQDPSVIKISHNASFERIALSAHLRLEKPLSPESWFCSMSYAAYCGIPSSLEKAGQILQIPHKKMEEGLEGILTFSTPSEHGRNLPQSHPALWKLFCQYCIRDVEAMREICQSLAEISPFSWHEWKLYQLDQKINDRGVRIDTRFIELLKEKELETEHAIFDRINAMGYLINLRSNKSIRSFLALKGIPQKVLNAAVIEELLSQNPQEQVRLVLQAWVQLHNSPLKKITNLQRMVHSGDLRLHGALRYYGTQHGEWTLRALSPQLIQNLEPESLDQLHQQLLSHETEQWDPFETIYPHLKALAATTLIPSAGTLFAQLHLQNPAHKIMAWLRQSYLHQIWQHRGDTLDSDITQKDASYSDQYLYDWFYRVLFQALRWRRKVSFLQGIEMESRLWKDKRILIIHTGWRPWILYDVKLERGWISYQARPKQGKNERISMDIPLFFESMIQTLARDLFAQLLLALDQQNFRIVFHYQRDILMEFPHSHLSSIASKLRSTLASIPFFLPIDPEFSIRITSFYHPY